MTYDWTEWNLFAKLHLHPDRLLADEKEAMFNHAWANPNRNVDEYHEALLAWRRQQMGVSL